MDKKLIVAAGGVLGVVAIAYLLSQNSGAKTGGVLSGGMWGFPTSGYTAPPDPAPPDPAPPVNIEFPGVEIPPMQPPAINYPEVEPVRYDYYYSSGGSGGGSTKKQTVYTDSAGSSSPSSAFGGSSGFGGGGVGGRGDDDGGGILGLLGGIISSLFSPVNLALSAPLLGGVAGVLGPATTAVLPAFEAVTKKGAATATTTSYIASAPIVSSPADAISEFYGAGVDYTTPVDMTKKGSAVTTVYESGAYQTVSQGQIVSAGSPGSTAPPASAPSTGAAHAAATGQVYSPPGTSLGGSSGTVMSKKSASILSGDSAAARAWRERYGGSNGI